MSKFSWRNGLAIGIVLGGFFSIFCLVWVIGLNYCPNSPCEYQDSNQQQPADDEYWLPNPFGSNIASDPHPADQDDHPKYYEHQDLAAQEIMAEATKWIVILTGISLFIGAVGAGAIIWTLLESRKVSSAAIEANQIMRNEQSPILVFEELRFQDIANEPGFAKFHAAVIFKNVGKTPARVLDATLKVTGGSDETGEEREIWSWEKSDNPKPIAADREYESPFFCVDSTDFESGDVLYYLSFKYVSIFDKGEIETFGIEVKGRIAPVALQANGEKHVLYNSTLSKGTLAGMKLPIGPGGIKYTTERKQG